VCADHSHECMNRRNHKIIVSTVDMSRIFDRMPEERLKQKSTFQYF